MDTKTKRRWFRFSLRTLMIFVTIASAAFGWLGVKVRQALLQKEAAGEVLTLGGEVLYDYQFTNGDWDAKVTLPGPAWLQNIADGHFLKNAVGINFWGFSPDDQRRKVAAQEVPSILPRFPKVQWLDLNGLPISDEGLMHLEGMTQLKNIHLINARVSDAGLVHLSRLTNLQGLSLTGARVTDAGLEHLQAMTQLRTLSLTNCGVTDRGLTKLQHCTELESLDLLRSNITDGGLAYLRRFKQLQWLRLSDTQVSDVGLAQLEVLTSLQWLHLDNNWQVTDAGLIHLRCFTKLRYLDVRRTQTTIEGCQKLQEVLPELKIEW